nr:MAG TPA: hypothetical protein [Bacteriophage sp.]
MQSDLLYSPIAVFKIALKQKRPLRFYPQEPFGGIARLYSARIVSDSIIPRFRSDFKSYLHRKRPLVAARGLFPRKDVYDGKPSECLNLFAVLMLHNDGIFTAFAVRSGIVFAGFVASNEA